MFNHRKVVSWSRQDGVSALGMVAGLAALVAVVVLMLRLGPHYIDFQTMGSVMEGLNGLQVNEMDKRAIFQTLEKRFKINNLRSFRVRDRVSIERDKTGTTVVVKYEVREPLIGNADIVLAFDEKYSYH
jgi:hypothetical protein